MISMTFGSLRDAHKLLRLDGFKADAVAFDGLVEALRRDQHRSLQQPTVLHFF
jgi:hypothetical protein